MMMDDDGLLVDDRRRLVLIDRLFFALPGPGDSVRWALPGVVELLCLGLGIVCEEHSRARVELEVVAIELRTRMYALARYVMLLL